MHRILHMIQYELTHFITFIFWTSQATYFTLPHSHFMQAHFTMMFGLQTNESRWQVSLSRLNNSKGEGKGRESRRYVQFHFFRGQRVHTLYETALVIGLRWKLCVWKEKDLKVVLYWNTHMTRLLMNMGRFKVGHNIRKWSGFIWLKTERMFCS
jgi:hypothetical protein